MSKIRIDDSGLSVEIIRDDAGEIRLTVIRDFLPVVAAAVKPNGDVITHCLPGGKIAGSLAAFGGFLFLFDANGESVPLPPTPAPSCPAAAPGSSSNHTPNGDCRYGS